MVSESQVGFRKGKGIIDNIYCINYLVEREVGREEKMIAALMDLLRVAFDSVNRKMMRKRLEKRVSRRLRERIMKFTRKRKAW